VLSAIWLLAGLLARPTLLAAARRAPDVRILKAITDVNGRLEDRMIALGFPAVIVTGVATAVAGDYSFFGPFSNGPWWIFLSILIMALIVVGTPRMFAHDRRWGQAIDDSARAGVITDQLRPFLERNAMIRRYAPDMVSVLVIVVLMVAKPF